MAFPPLLTALAVVRERERGSLLQLYTSPIRAWEFLGGKLLPYAAIAFLEMLLLLAVGTLWFEAPVRGSVPLLLGLSLFYVLCTVGIGLLISTLTKSQVAAILLAIILTLMPSFLFSGFLPVKDKARRDRLAQLAEVPATLIFFESPHRIGATLAAAAEVLGGERSAAVCRELTKTFEEFRRGTLAELKAFYDEGATVKGEIVLVIGPPDAPAAPEADDVDAILRKLVKDMSTGKAATEAARQTGLNRKDLYDRLLELKDLGLKDGDDA